MSNPLQVKVFSYDQVDQLNQFMPTVELPPQGAIHFRDQGVIVVYQEKRKHAGLTREEHIDSVKDELAKAEAELGDALLSRSETELGYQNFKGKAGMKKIEDAFLNQMALDRDTVDNKKAKVIALRSLLVEIVSGLMPIGNDAVEALFAEEQKRKDAGTPDGIPVDLKDLDENQPNE